MGALALPVWSKRALFDKRFGGTCAVPLGAEGHEACPNSPTFHLFMHFAVKPGAVLMGARAYFKVWHRP